MAGMKTIASLSFLLAIGILLVILSCALYNNWWPLFVVLIYAIAPVPNMIATALGGAASSDFFSTSSDAGSPSGPALGFFFTAVFLVSGLALPLVLLHAAVITETAVGLAVSGGLLIYLTILGYTHFFVAPPEETW